MTPSPDDFRADPRHLLNGRLLPSRSYCDQPYVAGTDDGAWLAVMTTGAGHEGARGQHVVALRSADQGLTWSDPVAIEPADGPEASYAVLLKAASGRIYAFYNHNTDGIREVAGENGETFARVDSLGHYVFKFSDDHGRTWSPRRYEVPIREFEVDRRNRYGGAVRFFWNVGKPCVRDGTVFLPHIKVAAMGEGFFAQSEGALLRSPNLLTEPDPEKIVFETLPEGGAGLRAPEGGGRVAEEQSVVALSDGTLYCVYRTVDGWPACAFSRDDGRSWTAPQYKRYAPGPEGRRFKHPRAANFVWKCANGRYLYWFHNHGGPAAARGAWNPYDDRNPAWLSAGREIETPQGRRLAWSEPEIVLYDDDPFIRMSYPDLIEEKGRFFLAETQKAVARIHELDPRLPGLLFSQHERREAAADGLLLESAGDEEPEMPGLPALYERDRSREDQAGCRTRAGFTVELGFRLSRWTPGLVLFDTLGRDGRGLRVATAAGGRLAMTWGDGRALRHWETDRGLFREGALQHAAWIFDGGPGLLLPVVNGALNDGGDERQFGWARIGAHFTHANGAPRAALGAAVSLLRVYGRALAVSEAVGNARAFLEAAPARPILLPAS